MRTSSVLVFVFAAGAAGCASTAARPAPDPLIASLKDLGVEGRSYVNDLGAVSSIDLRAVHPMEDDFLVEDIHGHLSYVDGTTLNARWSYFGMTAPFDERPDVTETMVVGVSKGTVYALSRRNGLDELSPAPVGVVLSAGPVANESTLFAPTYATPVGNKTVQSVGLSSGYLGWGWRTNDDIVASLAKAGPHGGDMFYAATTRGDVYGFPTFPEHERDPEPAWKTPLNAGVHRDLVVLGDDLGVVTSDNRLVCLDRITGRLRWEAYAAPREQAASAAQFSAKHAFYVCGGELRAFDRATGSKAWAVKGASHFVCERGGRTIVASADGTLTAVDTATGKVLGSAKAPGWTFPARTVPDATVFAVSNRGTIVGIESGW